MSRPLLQSVANEGDQIETADEILARMVALNVPRPTHQKSVEGAPILQPSPPPTRPQTQVVQAPTPRKPSVPGAAHPMPPAPTAAQQSPPAPHAAPAPLRAPTTAVVDKLLWIYVSNAQLPGRRRG